MTQEEKAKRYDEAIHRASGFRTQEYKDVAEYIFPELKESEDDRIRKALIEMIHDTTGDELWVDYDVHKEDALAWLEKVGNIIKEWGDLKVRYIQDDLQEMVDLKQKTEQSKQKSTDKVEPKFKIEEGKWYICISQFCNCIEGRVYKATSDSRIIDDFGTEYDMHSDSCKNFRPWTIQDAKDGDVLATPNSILVFKEFLENDGGISYCHYDFGAGNPQFIWSEDKNWYFGKEAIIHPATKEQRDTLERAMTNAGYRWNKEELKLEKI